MTSQKGAAVIRLVDDRATGFGSGCRSPADPERLQTVLTRCSTGPAEEPLGADLPVPTTARFGDIYRVPGQGLDCARPRAVSSMC